MRYDERGLRRREWSPAVCVCVRAWLRAWLRVHLCVRVVCMGLLSKAAPSEVPSWSPRFVPAAFLKQHSRFARPPPPSPPLFQSFSPGGARKFGRPGGWVGSLGNGDEKSFCTQSSHTWFCMETTKPR